MAWHCDPVPEAGPVPAGMIYRLRGLLAGIGFRKVFSIAVLHAVGITDEPSFVTNPSVAGTGSLG